jgi:hypothetical protein
VRLEYEADGLGAVGGVVVEQLERELAEPDLPERAVAALKKNLELKQRLFASLSEVGGNVKALLTELDSIESLLEMLHQNSISLRDPQAISADLDTIVRQSEDSERVVREMESLLRSEPTPWLRSFARESPPAAPERAPQAGNTRPKVRGR